MVHASGYSNDWWTLVSNLPNGIHDGWMSNIYIKGKEKIEGVPDCYPAASSPPAQVSASGGGAGITMI